MKQILFYVLLLHTICSCNKDEDGGVDNPGGNGNCAWEKSSNKLELISVSPGTECGNEPTSLAVSLKNISDQKVRVAICFQMDVRQDPAGWSIQDHTIDAGETKKLYICEYSTGDYKYWAMNFVGNENCQLPNCQQ